MIESKNLVPEYYRKSYDYKVLLKLLDYVVASSKGEIDDICSVLVPSRCPKDYLPMLAEYVGYEYDPNVSEDVNRKIIEEYTNLIRNRGSLDSIGNALTVAIRAVQKTLTPINKLFLVDKIRKILTPQEQEYYQQDLDSEYVVSAFIYSDNFSYKMWDLIRAVRPAGMNVIINSSSVVDTDNTTEQINLGAFLSNLYRAKISESLYTVATDDVGGNMSNWQSGVSLSINRKNIPNSTDSVDDEDLTGNQGGKVNFVELSHNIQSIEIPSGVTVLFDIRDGNGCSEIILDKSGGSTNCVNATNSYNYYNFDLLNGYIEIHGLLPSVSRCYLAYYLSNKWDLTTYSKMHIVCGYKLSDSVVQSESTISLFILPQNILDVATISGFYSINYPYMRTVLNNRYVEQHLNNCTVIDVDLTNNNGEFYIGFMLSIVEDCVADFSLYAIYVE